AVANFALDIRERLGRMKISGDRQLQMRIGINTGPAVAGVIGTKRFIYDIWGDSVNVASRMESHAEPGTIQVSHDTAERLKRSFVLEKRGEIEVKGKGIMQTFFLLGRQTGYS